MHDLTEIEKIIESNPEIGKLLFDNSLLVKINEIAEINKFPEDLYNIVIEEITYVVVGLEKKESFVETITAYGVDENVAREIYNEANISFFLKVNKYKGTTGVAGQTNLKPNWDKIIDEISRKYGLEEDKKKTLISVCQEIVADNSKKSNILSDLANKLNISSIVAEQISEELDGRVFTVTPKFTPITKTESPRPISTPQIQEIPPEQTFLTPEPTNPEKEYTPPNLPVAEEDRELIKEKVSIPRYVPTSVEEIRAKENERYEALKNDTAIKMQAEKLVGGANVASEPSKIIYKPENSPLVSPEEVVQRTTQVPRFNLASETAPDSAQSTSFVDQKLSGFVVPKEEEKPSAPESPIVKSYSVDPYREPVE